MKTTLVYAAAAVLCLAESMTAIVHYPGGMSYELVLKPYPSLLKVVPGREMDQWEQAARSGEVPNWVRNKQYIAIASGDGESTNSLWELAYSVFNLGTAGFLLLSAVLFGRSLVRRR